MTAREDNASKAQFALIVKHEKSVRFTTKERRDLLLSMLTDVLSRTSTCRGKRILLVMIVMDDAVEASSTAWLSSSNVETFAAVTTTALRVARASAMRQHVSGIYECRSQ